MGLRPGATIRTLPRLLGGQLVHWFASVAGALIRRLASAASLFALALPAAQAQTPLPIFDAHIHYSHDAWDVVPTDKVIALMRQAGLQGALVSSSNDEGTQRLLKAAPDLVIPSLRPYRNRGELSSWVRDDAVLAHVEQRLSRYRYAAFGEFHLFGADAELPNVRRMLQLAVQNNLVLHAHSDIDAIERLFRQFPNARIIWAHSGFERPAAVAALLRRHRQLWADLAYRSDMGSGGKIDSEWAAVVNELPTRFLVGTDTFTPERLHYIPEHANYTRAWLSALPRETAERIAYRNAQDLLRPIWLANRADAPCTPDSAALPAAQQLANERVRLIYAAVPAPIRLGQAFSIHAEVCPLRSGAKVQAFAVDATMPAHRHGMNYQPSISTRGPQGYAADGLMLHMAGHWQLAFELRIDGQTERLTQDVMVR